MLPIVFSLIFLTGNALASPIANHYIESVLNTALRSELRAMKLDPADLLDFVTEFEDKVAIIGKVKGRSQFSNGKLFGLSEVKRVTECQGPTYSYGVKSINCSISFTQLKIDYDGKMKYGKMPNVNIKGKANVTNNVVFIEVSSSPQGMPPTLNKFLFQSIGQLNMKFTGLGPLNKFTKFLEDGFKAHADAELFNSMSQKFQFALNKAVGMVPMPN